MYPIRLTASAGSEVYLELFVIADKRAENPKLTLELCDEYVFKQKAGYSYAKKYVAHYKGDGYLAGFVGRNFYQRIGHPEADKYFWDGCTLSKLCGTLDSNEMNEDIVLELRKGKPHRKCYYSKRGAKESSLLVCLSSWCLLLIILTFVFKKKIQGEKGRRFALVRIAMPVIFLSILFGGLSYAVLPKVETETRGNTGSFFMFTQGRTWIDFVKNAAISHEYGYYKGMSKDEITQVIEDYHKFVISKNGHTGGKMEPEDSPGNFTVFEDERGVVFRTYSAGGFPSDFIITDEEVSAEFEVDRRGAEKGYEQLAKMSKEGIWYKDSRWIFAAWPTDYEFHANFIKLYRKQPKELIPVVLNDVGLRLKKLVENTEKAEYELRILGCISHIEPPMDVNDEEAVQKFLEKVEAWYAEGQE